MQLERDGEVAILHLGDGENRFNRDSLDSWFAALDEVEASAGPVALVAVGDGKIWSNGLDLEWLMATQDPTFLPDVHRLFARMLTMPCITVAALNGHTFAAGAMLSVGFDRRLMREDRGWWCLPEVDLGIPLTVGMDTMITHRLPRLTAHDAIVTAHRYTGTEALAAGIVHALAPEDRLLADAVEMARPLAGKAGPALGTIKRVLHRQALEILADPASSVALPPGT